MSFIQKIRDKAAWIVFGAIVVALLSFILQDAFFNKGRSGMGSGGTTVGKINGTAISHDVFEQKINFYDQATMARYNVRS